MISSKKCHLLVVIHGNFVINEIISKVVLKNIRCFPICSEPHRLRGFCGNSITFQLGKTPAETAVTFGEFVLKDSSTLRVGSIVSEADVLAKERKEDLFKPWHRGETVEGNSNQIVFNKQKKGWHYSWVSNKHTSNSEHVFRVYLLEPTTDGKGYQCIGVYNTPPFTIFCRRRDKSGVEHLPPQFASYLKPPSSEEEEEEEEEEEKETKTRTRSKRAKKTTTTDTKPISTAPPLNLKFLDYASAPPKPLFGMSPKILRASTPTDNAVVFRILAALTNVHDRLGADGATNKALANANDVSSISTPATPSTIDANEDLEDLFENLQSIK